MCLCGTETNTKGKMAFVKEVRSKSYYKRYQTKYRRRREGRTDYKARARLVGQDNTKYNTPKHRLVVRFSNRYVTAQIVRTLLEHDVVVVAAYSFELAKYGLTVGLSNYAAAYATGLLLARRTLKQFNMDEDFEGNEEVGEDYNSVDEVDSGERQPFRAILDVGLRRTSRGSKLFAVMKGACDGGLNVPHEPQRFVGYDPQEEELDSDKLRSYIMGGHVSAYMDLLKESNPEKYETHFSKYIKAGVTPEKLEDLLSSVHENIRAAPARAPKSTKDVKSYPKIKGRRARLTRKARVNRVNQRMAAFKAKIAAEMAG